MNINMETKTNQLQMILDEIRKENAKSVKRNARFNYEMLKASEELASRAIEEEIEACREAMRRLTTLRRQIEAEVNAIWNDIEDAITVIQVESETEAEDDDESDHLLMDMEIISGCN